MEQDAERLLLLQKILDLLLAGGYFRARISSLSPFDKLTGGLAWCITASNVDVEFNIFYDDDATLGYKIKVGEAIEGALQKMGCPYPLQAHQIQGLDYRAVYPVVQWLIKRVLTTRETLGDQLRRYSHLHFHGHYDMPEGTALQPISQKTKTKHESIVNQRPERLYRRVRNVAPPVKRVDRLQCTLLEYGHFFARPMDHLTIEEHAVSSDSPALEGSLSALQPSTDESLTSSRVGHILGLCSEEVRVAASQYSQPTDALTAYQKQVVSLLKQIEGEEKHKNHFQDKIKNATETILKLKHSSREQEEQRVALQFEMDRLFQEAEEAGVGGVLQKLLPLVKQWKTIEEEEIAFRTNCKEKRSEMLSRIAKLESQVDSFKDNAKYEAEVDDTLSRDLLKLKFLKGDMSKINQNVFLLRRKLDDVPSPTELMQYERCFVELSLHIQSKLRETRKYYAMYNALAEANELTVKEISLLNSMNTQFEAAMITSEGRMKFVASMSDIAKGMQQKLEKMEARTKAEQSSLSALREQHGQKVAARRHYVNLMKLFQEECAKNAKLRYNSSQRTTSE